jgi:hypothetical protein
VPNLLNPAVTGPNGFFTRGGTPFSPQYMPFNAPNLAVCKSATAISCTASFQTYLAYLNYKVTPLDNLTYRAEFVDDMQGQRTGTKTRYIETAVGWQHWFSPQIEIRPEVSYYKSLDGFAFNGNATSASRPARTTPSSVRRTSSFTSEAWSSSPRHGDEIARLLWPQIWR